jgi:hypothetical protein
MNFDIVFRDNIAVYCENHMKHANALYVQDVDFEYCDITPESWNDEGRIGVHC